MKLTAEEKEVIAERRRAEKSNKLRQRKADEAFEAEMKRMDTPGTGCLDCKKTEREVLNEGRWGEDGNHLLDAGGTIQLLQCIQRGMGGEEYAIVFEGRLCNDCLGKRVKSFGGEVKP